MLTKIIKMGMILCVSTSLSLVVAQAEVLNVKVGGDTTCYGFLREDYDLNSSTKDNQQFLSSITHFYVESELSDSVNTLIQLVNERGWDQETAAPQRWKLYELGLDWLVEDMESYGVL